MQTDTDYPTDAAAENGDCSAPLCRRSIGTQLLVAVNAVSVILAGILLTVDYRHEVSRRIEHRRVALSEEAVALHAAVRGIQHHGLDAIQQYVDGVCERMETAHSPGHHIVVKFGDYVLQATAHHQASEGLFESIRLAADSPNGQSEFGGQELLASTMQDRNLQIFVSEFIDADRAEAQRDALLRMGAMVLLGAVAALVVNLVLMSLVVRPIRRLAGIVERVGQGELSIQAGEFRNRELSVLSTSINRMQDALATSERRRQRSLEKARALQRRLLPDLDSLPGCEVAVIYRPAEDVAGDFFDFHLLDDGSWLACVADVTGHGIPAAMSASLLKAFLLDATERFHDPLQIVDHVNRRFEATALRGDFATLILIHYSPKSQRASVISAGHEPALLQRADGRIEEVGSSGLPVGVLSDTEWSIQTLILDSKDRVLITTDGVTETAGADRVLFGRERLKEILERTIDQRPSTVLDEVQHQVDAYRAGSQLDDVTLMLLQFQLTNVLDR